MKLTKKFRLPKGLQRRWMINIMSIVAGIVALAVLAFSLANGIYLYNSMRSGLEAKARTSTDFLNSYLGLNSKDYYNACVSLAQNFEDKNNIELQFIRPDGTIVASSYGTLGKESVFESDITQALQSGQLTSFTGKNPSTGERIMSVSMPMVYSDGQTVGVLRYVTSLRLADRQIFGVLAVTLLVGLAVMAIIIFSSRLFMRSILEPISEITETAKHIAAGSYGAQIKKKYDDEIGELADTVNDMSTKISQSEKMQSEFMSSVSHELRTPLTAITGWGETILSDEEMNPAVTKRGMEIILRESKRLTSMVEDLLEFTRMQDGRFTLNIQTGDILADFEDTVFMYGSRLQQEGIELEYIETQEEIPEIPCDPSRLRQVFLNILDNAAKHGGEGKKITAGMTREGDQVVVRIRDFGPGIPEDELPHVKMKFYKGSSKARGSGIGLAVCEEIITMHNGTLTLTNAEGGGTLVTISLPIPEET